jgi:dolichol-phosphate mannosyltransferase
LRGLRSWVGFRQAGVDYVRPERAFGRSTHSFLKNFWWARKAIYSFTFLPIELLGYLAAILTLLSLGASVLVGVDALGHPELPLGTSAVLVAVAFFGSLNLLAMTILGEYLIKIFEETKHRPKFIRKAIRYADQHFATAEEIDNFVRQRTQATASRQASRTNVGVGRPGEVGDAN